MKFSPKTKAAMVDLSHLSSGANSELLDDQLQRKRPSLGTAPGQAMQNIVLREKLAEWDEASPTRRLDPKLIIRTKWSNRHSDSFVDKDFLLLKADIESSNGNVQPIKVRKSEQLAEKYEIIFGHRRHQACLELKIPVFALIVEVDEAQLFVEMDRENRQRKDLRPYEQGLMYKKALDEGLFPSARKLSESAGIDIASLGKILSLAKLPDDVINAFTSPLDLQYGWASKLTQALTKDRELVLATARRIQTVYPRPPARQVLASLINGLGLPNVLSNSNAVSMAGALGQSSTLVLNAVANKITINLSNVSADRFDELQLIIKKFIS